MREWRAGGKAKWKTALLGCPFRPSAFAQGSPAQELYFKF
jgi:hypothetical protein